MMDVVLTLSVLAVCISVVGLVACAARYESGNHQAALGRTPYVDPGFMVLRHYDPAWALAVMHFSYTCRAELS